MLEIWIQSVNTCCSQLQLYSKTNDSNWKSLDQVFLRCWPLLCGSGSYTAVGGGGVSTNCTSSLQIVGPRVPLAKPFASVIQKAIESWAATLQASTCNVAARDLQKEGVHLQQKNPRVTRQIVFLRNTILPVHNNCLGLYVCCGAALSSRYTCNSHR